MIRRKGSVGGVSADCAARRGVAVHASRQCDIEDHFEQNYNHAGTGTNEEQRGGAGIAEGDESGFQSRKDKTACSCRLSPRSPRPRDVISTKKSVQNYKTGFLRRSTAVSSQGARAGERGRVRLAGTASPHLCPADARHDLKTGFCLRSPPRRLTDHLFFRLCTRRAGML